MTHHTGNTETLSPPIIRKWKFERDQKNQPSGEIRLYWQSPINPKDPVKDWRLETVFLDIPKNVITQLKSFIMMKGVKTLEIEE